MRERLAVEEGKSLQTKAQEHKFRSLQELADGDQEPGRTSRAKLPADLIKNWMAQRPGSTARTQVKIKLGFPDSFELPVTFLAVARHEDFVEVLNEDGKTHRFALDEIILA